MIKRKSTTTTVATDPPKSCEQECGTEDDIFQFLDGIDEGIDFKREAVVDNTADGEEAASSSTSTSTNTSKSINDVWPLMGAALDDWMQRIVDTESRQTKCTAFRRSIDCALHRMLGDGLLNQYDINELQYVAGLWSELLSATSCYTVGCSFAKRAVITLLLELYTLKQVNSELFIDACVQL